MLVCRQVHRGGSQARPSLAPQIGLVAAGGEVSAQVTGLNDSSVAVQSNTLDSRVEVAGEQALVASVLDVVTGLGERRPPFANSCLAGGRGCLAHPLKPIPAERRPGSPRPSHSLCLPRWWFFAPAHAPSTACHPPAAFNKTGFNLPAALDEVQRQLCATLAAADWAAVGAELRGTLRPLADQLGGLLCSGAGTNPDVNLSSLAGKVEELAGEGLGALASLLEGVLGDPALAQVWPAVPRCAALRCCQHRSRSSSCDAARAS